MSKPKELLTGAFIVSGAAVIAAMMAPYIQDKWHEIKVWKAVYSLKRPFSVPKEAAVPEYVDHQQFGELKV